ncbi:MAG: DUF2312 domain-containing protein [Candidatus Paracaedibacteraceae bacterium]|nr:DUF2312 domain-containing protein [Candidatus Paracaedibacteraceae bacterium]
MQIINNSSANQLRLFIEKVERLEEEKSELMENIREVFSEAKAVGFDPKVMKQIIKLRKMKHEEAVEQEELLDIYRAALGMIPSGRIESNELPTHTGESDDNAEAA